MVQQGLTPPLELITNLYKLLSAAIEDVAPYIEDAAAISVTGGLFSVGDISKINPADILKNGLSADNIFNKELGTPISELLVQGPFGLLGTPEAAEAKQAFDILSTMMGFAVQLAVASAVADEVGNKVFGAHGAPILSHTIGRLTEAMGINFFLGTAMASMFEASVAPQLEVAINKKYHPARVDIATARALLKQHKINQSQFNALMDELGVGPDVAQYYQELDAQNLSATDILLAEGMGLMSADDAQAYLQKLGYNDTDIGILTALATKKNVGSGGTALLNAARRAYAQGSMSADQFRQIATQAGMSPDAINEELAAMDLDRQTSKLTLSVTDLKQGYLHGDFGIDQVRSKLIAKGYSATDADVIIKNWEDTGTKTSRPVSQQRILTYLQSGVISSTVALNMLIADGVKPQDAQLLVAHPAAGGSSFRYELSPTVVTSALKEGVITVDQAKQKLDELHVDPVAANLMIATANAQKTGNKKPKQDTKRLSVADIKDAFENGLAEISWAHQELVNTGYSDQDAAILTAIWFAKDSGKPPDGWPVLT